MAIYIDDYRSKETGYFLNRGDLSTILRKTGKYQDIVAKDGQYILKITSTQANQLFIADTRFTDNIDDIDMLICFSVDAVQQVPGSYGILNWDYTEEGKGLSIAFLPARNNKALQLYDDSASRTVGFINYDWQNGKKYWVRWRVEGGRSHFVKIWRDGEVEPSAWAFSANYSNRTTGKKYIGYGTYGASHTVEYSFLGIGTGGDTAPASVAEYITRLQPSTPTGMFSSGYGGMAFGSEFRPAFTVNELDQHGNTRLQRTSATTQDGNARIQRSNRKDQDGNAFIQHQRHTTQAGNARIGHISTIEQRGNARIGGGNSIHQHGDATIIYQRQITQNGASFVEYQRKIYQNGRVFVIIQPNIAQNGNARIARLESVTQTGSAKISNPTPDKLPQNWRNSDEKQPKDWQNMPKNDQNWRNSGDEQPTDWKNSNDEVQQDWRDNSTRKEADWQRQYYD